MEALTGAVRPRGISCPVITEDSPPSTVRVAISYGDANEAARPLLVKMLASSGFAEQIPTEWPETSRTLLNYGGQTYTLPAPDGSYVEPEEWPPPPPTATAIATGAEPARTAAGITGEAFWDSVAASRAQAWERRSQLSRVRKENAAWKRKNGVGTRRERGLR